MSDARTSLTEEERHVLEYLTGAPPWQSIHRTALADSLRNYRKRHGSDTSDTPEQVIDSLIGRGRIIVHLSDHTGEYCVAVR